VRFGFAHRLRIELWAEHLGMDTPEGHAELADGAASAVHWLSRPDTARITKYDVDGPNCPEDFYVPWDTLGDPDGS
jgi:hypothetical protein